MTSEAVRLAFQELDNTGFEISNPQLLNMLKATGCEFKPGGGFSRSQFAVIRARCKENSGKGDIDISEHTDSQLHNFFYKTPLGRILRNPSGQESDGHDRLLKALSTPPLEGQSYAGLYFVLHGSYVHKRHRAVHFMEVTETKEHILEVHDWIDDNKGQPRGERESFGKMTIFRGVPQIITYGHENRLGLCLFIASEERPASSEKFGSQWIFGIMMGMRNESTLFRRKALLIKWLAAPRNSAELEEFHRTREAMRYSTGIYTKNEWMNSCGKLPAIQIIRTGFNELVDFMPTERLKDPCGA